MLTSPKTSHVTI